MWQNGNTVYLDDITLDQIYLLLQIWQIYISSFIHDVFYLFFHERFTEPLLYVTFYSRSLGCCWVINRQVPNQKAYVCGGYEQQINEQIKNEYAIYQVLINNNFE